MTEQEHPEEAPVYRPRIVYTGGQQEPTPVKVTVRSPDSPPAKKMVQVVSSSGQPLAPVTHRRAQALLSRKAAVVLSGGPDGDMTIALLPENVVTIIEPTRWQATLESIMERAAARGLAVVLSGGRVALASIPANGLAGMIEADEAGDLAGLESLLDFLFDEDEEA